MDTFHFNHITEYEYQIVIKCTEVMQRNLDCFEDAKDKLLITASITPTISKLKSRTLLSPMEFLVVLHSIELCALALTGLETINQNDLTKIQPYKKIIKELHRTYGTFLYL